MKNADKAKQLLRSKVLKSVTAVNHDEDLLPYLRTTVEDIARIYQKEVTDFSITDVKRAVDLIYELLKRFNLENATLTQVKMFGGHLQTAGDVGNIITFAEAVAGIVSGNFGWLLWHISKNLAAPRIKRATAVYLVGHLAATIYGGDVIEIEIKSKAIDPIFESMDRDMLETVAKTLEIEDLIEKSDIEIINQITEKFQSEAKDQGILSAWFPDDAESYLEGLVVVAKKKKIDIRGMETVEDIEGTICSVVFNEIWKKIPAKEREELSRKMAQSEGGVSGEYIFSAAGLGTIGLAQLSGFGIYSASSTLLAFISGSMGIPLGFGAYTGLSSIISVAIGPVGAVVLLPAIFEFLRAKPERTLIGAIAAISIFRSKLIAEGKITRAQDEKLKRTKTEVILICTTVLISIGLAVSLFYNFK